MVAVAPELAPLVGEMLGFGVRGFKAGRQMEGVIDQTIEAIEQKAQQPPPPSPDMIKAQNDQQKNQIAGQKVQSDHVLGQQKNQIEAAKVISDAQQAEQARIQTQLTGGGFY